MPNRADPGQERKPGPLATQGQGLGGHTSTQGAGDWRSPPPLAGPGPIIGSSPSSSTLHSPKKKTHTHTHTRTKTERTTQATRSGPETSRVPGFQEATQEGVEGRERRGSVPRERDCGGGEEALLLPGPLARTGTLKGSWKCCPGGPRTPRFALRLWGKCLGGRCRLTGPGLGPRRGGHGNRARPRDRAL